MRHAITRASAAAILCAAQALGCDPVEKAGTDTTTDQSVIPDAVEVTWDVEPPEGSCPEGWTCRLMDLPVFNGVDILVVVDDSASMAEEQETLVSQFPGLIEDLIWPVLSPYTGKPVSVPVTDVHIGVVSTDMGVAGYDVPGCSFPDAGDDGILQHEPYIGNPLCEDEYPLYLGYDQDAPVPDEVDWMGTAFSCIGQLGTDGCGMEQQLEAALQALTTNSEPGEPNAGFLRDDTVVVVVWLTDEDDASAEDPAFFEWDSLTLPHPNIRHYEMPEMLHPVQRYVDGLRALREGSPWPVLVAMIVGVPAGEPACNGPGDAIDGCLDRPLMQYEPCERTIGGETFPVPCESCLTDDGYAFPPIRLVEAAQGFGEDAYVHSICQEDYSPALDYVAARITGIAEQTCAGSFLQMDKDPADDCSCTTDCTVVHVIDRDGSCPAGTVEWDQDGDGNPEVVRDGDGDLARGCEVPFAGTVVDSCDRLCHDPLQHYSTEGEGWYYTLTGVGVACPSIGFTGGYETPSGAHSFVACPAR